MQFPDLTDILGGIAWAAVGAAATRLYMPERVTNDLDILVSTREAEQAREQLKQSGATYQAELSIGGSSWLLTGGFPLDMIECSEAWVQSALREAQTNLSADNMPTLSLEYLVLMKFQASRVQDLADITRMLGQANETQLQRVRAVFARWLPDAQEDLESLTLLGQLEMQ